MMSANAPDFGAASDGDGDRNMIFGRNAYVTPSDSLAILARQRPVGAGLRQGSRGRRALDADQRRRRPRRRQARHQVLRDADGMEVLRQPARRRAWRRCAARKASAPARTTSARRTACGRFCSGSISLPSAACPSLDLVREHWRTYGRNYYTRHDYEEIDLTAAQGLMAALARRDQDPSRQDASAPTRSRRPTISPITIRSTARMRPIRASG